MVNGLSQSWPFGDMLHSFDNKQILLID